IEGTGTNTNRLLQGNVAANESWVDYVFELPETRTVSISAQISTGAAASPLVVPQQWRVADQQGQITAEMPGGTHFVRLFGRHGETVPFSLSISAAPQDFVGNSFAAASYVGPVGDPPSAMVDFVGHSDGEDYFSFRVPPGSIVNADLVHTTGSGADIYLFDASEVLLTASTNPGDAYDTLSFDSLTGGLYYLRVAVPPVNGLNAQYTLRIGSIPLPISVPSNPPVSINCPQGLGPDGNNCIDSPEFFSGGFLNENSSIPPYQSNVGGLNDPVDHLTLRVTCNATAPRPTFNITSTGAVTVDLDRIRPDNGIRLDQPFAPGLPISPLAAEDRVGNRTYEYRFTVTPALFSIGGQSYNITATHTGCS
ncbi:MAG: PPC domain-containing protein, partial [Pseudomonadota bacterium]